MQYLYKMIGVVKDKGKERLKYWDGGSSICEEKKYIILNRIQSK